MQSKVKDLNNKNVDNRSFSGLFFIGDNSATNPAHFKTCGYVDQHLVIICTVYQLGKSSCKIDINRFVKCILQSSIFIFAPLDGIHVNCYLLRLYASLSLLRKYTDGL
jgi:hypothetical protein